LVGSFHHAENNILSHFSANFPGILPHWEALRIFTDVQPLLSEALFAAPVMMAAFDHYYRRFSSKMILNSSNV